MAEPMSNITSYCSEHAPKPDWRVQKFPGTMFVGKHVKIGFDVNRSEISKEHMWVLVERVDADEKMFGILANDSLYINDFQCGSPVVFYKTEIEAVLPSEWEGPLWKDYLGATK